MQVLLVSSDVYGTRYWMGFSQCMGEEPVLRIASDGEQNGFWLDWKGAFTLWNEVLDWFARFDLSPAKAEHLSDMEIAPGGPHVLDSFCDFVGHLAVFRIDFDEAGRALLNIGCETENTPVISLRHTTASRVIKNLEFFLQYASTSTVG